MKKKILLFIAATVLSMASAFAQGGTTGPLTWQLSGTAPNYTLTISGTGEMPDYDPTPSPWYSYRTSIKTLVLGNGITRIGQYAFSDHNNITGTLTLPNTLASIGDYAFYDCSGFTGTLTIPNSVTSIGGGAFHSCSGFTGTLNIGNSVTLIGGDAFRYCSGFTGTLTIPNLVTSIEDCAFIGCSGFTGTLTIPNLVISIGGSAFDGCSGFTGTLNIGNSVTSIGGCAFRYCSGFTGTLTIPNLVTSIGGSAFDGCSGFTTLNFNATNCTSIGDFAFNNCTSLSTLNIGNNVTKIPDYAFRYCSGITGTLNIGNSVTSIGVAAFQNCSGFTGTLTIPNSVTSIGGYAFVGCSGFTTLNFNATNCTYMGSSYNPVFQGCTSLTTLNIESNVTKLPSYAFKNCGNFTSITSHAQTPPVCGESAFEGVPTNIPVNVPCVSYFNYKDASIWKNFTNFITIGSTATNITYTAKCYTPYTDNYFTTPITSPGFYYTSLQNANICEMICLNLLNNPLPKLCMISVNEFNKNEIVWEKQDAVITAYNIYRESSQSGNYELIANIDYNSTNSWTDMESNAKIRSYRYKISGIDSCGKESVQSSAHKTMHLTINAGMNNSWNLIWTAYEGTSYSTYNIYRSSGETIGEMQLIGTMPAGNTSFSDFSAPSGYVYYMVEIVLNETCNVSKAGSSIKSNIATNKPPLTTLNIIATAETNGTITPAGEIKVEEGKNQTFTFAANSGYQISQVLVDGVNEPSAISSGSYTFENVTIDHTIHVDFAIVGITKNITENMIGVYPNPTTGKIRIESGELIINCMEIFDVYGRKVLSPITQLSSETVIDISCLTAGLYFLRINTEVGQVTKKVLKVHGRFGEK